MSIILRVDDDRAYLKSIYDYPRVVYELFPAIDSLGYSKPCKELMSDLSNRGIKASLFFQPFTVPNKDFAWDLLKEGHSIGLHAVHTKNFQDFLKDLRKISRKFKGKVYGFTKHGSGKLKLSRRHDPTYNPEKYIEYAKRANLKYFLGNGENPEIEKKVIDNVLYFQSAFWLDRNYREDKFSADWLIDESINRDIVVLVHPMDFVKGTRLMLYEYEKILGNVEFRKIDELTK